MNRLSTIILAGCVSLAVACGGGSKDEPSGPKGESHIHKESRAHDGKAEAHEHGGEHKGHVHKGHESKNIKKHDHHFSAEMKSFHDAMAPLWHAQKGDKRTADTCTAAPKLVTLAQAIQKVAKPEHATPDDWAMVTKQLVASSSNLVSVCKGSIKAFDTAFHGLHEGFHKVMKAMKKK